MSKEFIIHGLTELMLMHIPSCHSTTYCSDVSFALGKVSKSWQENKGHAPKNVLIQSPQRTNSSGAYQLPQESRSTECPPVSLEPTVHNLKLHWYLAKAHCQVLIVKDK